MQIVKNTTILFEPYFDITEASNMGDYGSNNIVVFLTIQYYCLSLRHE